MPPGRSIRQRGTWTKATRGPSDKGFDESLGITAADLERLVKSLVDAATDKPTDGKESK